MYKYFLIMLAMISVFSCNNNPIITVSPVIENSFDTVSIYNWSYSYLSFNFSGLYIIDSTNIYLTGKQTLRYDGENFDKVNIDLEYYQSTSIGVVNPHSIYLGGSVTTPGNLSKAQLVKLENNMSIIFPPLDDSTGTINDIVIESDNTVWLNVSEKNYVYKLENGSFRKYELVPKVRDGKFYIDEHSQLYLFKIMYGNDNITYLYKYKFLNDKFEKIGVDSSCNDCFNLGTLYKINDEILMGTRDFISFFNGNSWEKICNTEIGERYKVPPDLLAGISKNYFFNLTTYFMAPEGRAFMIWNENKWSWEKNFRINTPPIQGVPIEMKADSNNVYIVVNNGLMFSTFIRGKKLIN
jgi:hypothetical protein